MRSAMPGSTRPLVRLRSSSGASAGSMAAIVKVSERPYEAPVPYSSFSMPASFAIGALKSTLRTLRRSRLPAEGCSPSAFCWCGQACTAVARSASISASAAPGSKTSCKSSAAPTANVGPIDIAMPAVQKKG